MSVNGSRAEKLTEHSFGVGHAHDVRRRRGEERDAVLVARRHALRLARLERAVLERAHGVDPGLADAVHETAVDPARHPVDLIRRPSHDKQNQVQDMRPSALAFDSIKVLHQFHRFYTFHEHGHLVLMKWFTLK